MKHCKNVCAQGDLRFVRVNEEVPKNAVEVKPVGQYIVVGHSETGHHHVMEKEHTKLYKLPDSILNCLLVVEKPTVLEHLKPHDTHEPVMFDEGTYKVTRQREWSPQGWRQSQD